MSSTESTTPASDAVIEKRIYIGNVNFQTTEDELKELFAGLKVEEVEIPRKTYNKNDVEVKRSLGFAFVQFENVEDVEKSIELYNKKEFNGRALLIKRAKPASTQEERLQKQADFKKAKKEKLKAKKAAAAAAAKEANGENPTSSEKPKKEVKPKKEAKSRLPLEEGTPSADTVFINNLPYSLGTKQLNTLLKTHKPKWIHVPTRRVPNAMLAQYKKNGKPILNRGIAFVRLSNEESQKKFIEEFNGKDINGRAITVSVAIDSRIPKETDESVEGDSEPDTSA